MAFQKIFQGQRLDKFTAAAGRNFLEEKKKFWIDKFVLKALSSFTVLGLKLGWLSK